jgi:type IV secretory pathway VirJ component
VIVIAMIVALTAYSGYFGGEIFMPFPAKNLKVGDHPRISAVFVSGDVGMRFGMGEGIAQRLAADGIPVVAINSTAFFNRRRTPAEIAALIAEAARRAMALGNADRVVLIGHSYGADMLQVGYPELPPILRKKVAMVALIVPTDAIHFRISPVEMLGWTAPDMPASAVVDSLDGVPTLCIFGREEAVSPCAAAPRPELTALALPGGHGLDHDGDAVAVLLKSQIARITHL